MAETYSDYLARKKAEEDATMARIRQGMAQQMAQRRAGFGVPQDDDLQRAQAQQQMDDEMRASMGSEPQGPGQWVQGSEGRDNLVWQKGPQPVNPTPPLSGAAAYLAANPDVANDPYWGSRALEHYNVAGKNEGRQWIDDTTMNQMTGLAGRAAGQPAAQPAGAPAYDPFLGGRMKSYGGK